MPTKISIHVDGYYGLTEGVPRLLKLFEQKGIKVTFFVNMGREASIWDIIRLRGIPNKRQTTIKVQGRYTLLQKMSMLLLNRKIGGGHKKILNEIEKKGHRVEPHCWSHLEWSKNFENLDYKRQIYLFKKSFRECLGKNPESFAPPTWKINEEILKELVTQGFKEVCVLKRDAMKFKDFKGINFDILTFDKTIEELLTEGKNEPEIIEIYKREEKRKKAHIYFHADYEGIKGIETFEKILSLIKTKRT